MRKEPSFNVSALHPQGGGGIAGGGAIGNLVGKVYAAGLREGLSRAKLGFPAPTCARALPPRKGRGEEGWIRLPCFPSTWVGASVSMRLLGNIQNP